MFQFNKNQKGITLVFALLLMAAIMAVSLALSTIIVREMQLSQNIKQSSISYYGAETGLERVLYAYYKEDPLYEIPAGLADQFPDTFYVYSNVASWQLDVAENEEEVLADLAWEEGVKEVPLYDVLTGEPFAGLRNVKITWSEEGDQPEFIEWTLLHWRVEQGNIVLEPETVGANIEKDLVQGSLAPNNTITIPVRLLTGGDYPAILRFKHVGAGGQGKTVSFTVTATGLGGDEDFIAIGQETGMQVSGTSLEGDGDISRALEVNIPRKSPAFGVFDYLLFSDTAISKEWPL